MAQAWPDGWWRITDPKHVHLFREELAREIGRGHPLEGLACEPLARRDGRDDYLFEIADGRVVEVHLTFANHPERPPWPVAAIFKNLDAWLESEHGS